MKKQAAILSLLFVIISIVAMEIKEKDLMEILLDVPSLKFLTAWQVVQQEIPYGSVPEEVLEYVNYIKSIRSCYDCSAVEKKLFLNLVNNPDVAFEKISKFLPDLIQTYFGKRAPINCCNRVTYLLYNIFSEALRNRKRMLAKLTIKFICDVNFVSPEISSEPLLLMVAGEDNIEIAKLLLKKNADINIKDCLQNTALIKASRWGNKKIAKLLIDSGADVNIQNHYLETALILSARTLNGGKKIFKMLLAKNANVNLKNKYGDTALFNAAEWSEPEIIEMLLNAGAEINVQNKNGDTALIEAARKGHSDNVQMLVDQGADVNIVNNDGCTALDQTIFRSGLKFQQIVKVLKKAGGITKYNL